MKEVASVIETLSMSQISSILNGNAFQLDYSSGKIELDADAIVVQRTEKEHMKVLNEGNLTVGLNTEITRSLRLEGVARDIIRSIQNLRKESGLDVTDRIQLYITGDKTAAEALAVHSDYIARETLASFNDKFEGDLISMELGDIQLKISLTKDLSAS
jgi:isoleucyl-tRNA synthetase